MAERGRLRSTKRLPRSTPRFAGLEQLPATLGKQTSHYIEAGIRASIKGDFERPIEVRTGVGTGERGGKANDRGE